MHKQWAFRLDRFDDPPTPYSPLWWLNLLEGQLRSRNARLSIYDDYYEGRHPLAFASEKFKVAFGGQFDEFADNWCPIVVDAVEERLNPVGFRFPADSDDQERLGDKEAWRIWQANALDAGSQQGHIEALLKEESYAIVWNNPADPETPLITVEDPTQVIVAKDSSTRTVRAALKMWTDDSGSTFATVYLPDAIYKYKTWLRANSQIALPTGWSAGPNASERWLQREVDSEPWPLKNPMGRVPVVPFTNRPRLTKPGVSEIKQVIPLQDSINKLVADMLVASEYGSFRQRWATGYEVPRDPETKQPIETFKNKTFDRFFWNKNPDGKFGDFEQTQLENFVNALEAVIRHLAAQTRTPQHYFYDLRGSFPSGDAIKSAETGLVAKVKRKQVFFGESWEETMRLAFLVLDDPRSQAVGAETIWADCESRSESERADALVKRQAIGVPQQQLWEDAGYTPQQIERFVKMHSELPQQAAVAAAGARIASQQQVVPEPVT